MLSVLALLLFGGPVLFNFSLAFAVGIVIVVGTFSSVYVAAALLLYMPPIVRPEVAATAGVGAQPAGPVGEAGD